MIGVFKELVANAVDADDDGTVMDACRAARVVVAMNRQEMRHGRRNSAGMRNIRLHGGREQEQEVAEVAEDEEATNGRPPDGPNGRPRGGDSLKKQLAAARLRAQHAKLAAELAALEAEMAERGEDDRNGDGKK